MTYGYARVSSKGQAVYGNSLEDQAMKLREKGCEVIYSDSFTGTKMNRPEFSKLMKVLQPGDRLVVTKLDRFARNAADGARTVQELTDRGIVVDVLNMGVADNTPMGKLMVTMMFAFAEFERDMIVERTTTGREIAKKTKEGWREGRRRKELPDFEVLKERNLAGEMTVDECCAVLHISRGTWYNRCAEKTA